MGIRIEDDRVWLDDAPIPALYVDKRDDPHGGMSHGWSVRRCRLGGENGWALSITWGSGTYSSNTASRTRGELVLWSGSEHWMEEADTVEIAIIPPVMAAPDGTMHGGDTLWPDNLDLLSWTQTDKIRSLLDELATWPSSRPPVRPATAWLKMQAIARYDEVVTRDA